MVGGVEVSVDGGATWHPATGPRGLDATRWTPTADGPATIRSRAVDDSGNLGTPSDGVTVVVAPAVPTICPCSIFEDEHAVGGRRPTTPRRSSSACKFRSDDDGYITGVRFYKGPGNTGTHVGHLWTAGGQQLAEATFTGETASGWQQVDLPAPVAVTADTTYVASYYTPTGHYAFDSSYFAAGRGQPAAARAGRRGGRRQRRLPVRAERRLPDTTPSTAANYWVDVVFERVVAPDTRRRRSRAAHRATARPTSSRRARHRPLRRADGRGHDRRRQLRAADRRRRPRRRRASTYDAATRTATLTPDSPLARSTTYTATVHGGLLGRRRGRRGQPHGGRPHLVVHHGRPAPTPPDDGPGARCS